MTSPRHDPWTLSSRASHVVLAVAMVTAVSGYFMGLGQLDRVRGTPARDAGVPAVHDADAASGNPPTIPAVHGSGNDGVRSVVEYARFGDAGLKPNAHWRSSLMSLRSADARATDSGTNALRTGAVTLRAPATDAERLQAVRRRAERRAFDGAPPVVPHPVDATSSANCRVCHSQGLAVRDVVAPRMSHPEMGNCTQCHVESGGSLPGESAEWAIALAANGFEGRTSVGRGSRAWPGAPPTIPHALWMRENCASCHGPTGLVGLRTSHPERTLCTQCHVPDGGFEPGWAHWADLTGTGPGAGLNASR